MHEAATKISPINRRIGSAIEPIADNPVPNVTGKDFPTPGGSQVQGLSPMSNHQFRVQTDLDLGKFSGSDPVPTNELTFEQ